MSAENKHGKLAKVEIGDNKLLGMGTWSMSGITREVSESTEFGDDIKKYEFGQADGGEITISGLYMLGDTTGQDLMDSACKNASKFTGGDIKLYVDNTRYWTVDTGGNLLVTKAKAVAFDKAQLGKADYTIKVSGAAMVLI